MYEALITKLGSLPDDTVSDRWMPVYWQIIATVSLKKVYCGHEYTVNNLKYARHADSKNEEIRKKLAWAQVGAVNSTRLSTIRLCTGLF